MAFSLRSFFGKGGSEATAAPDSNGAPSSDQVPQAGSPFTAVGPAPGAPSGSTPFSGGLLFKTAAPESLGQPVSAVSMSPFSSLADTSPGLTIGDLLSSLPPDVAKNPGVPPTQPVQIPDAVLENALRSGRPVLPLFEVYRACPAMFQTPVGPHDAREVPLPTHKLAQLLSVKAADSNGTGAASLGSLPPSPFGMSPFVPASQAGTTASSPFGFAPSVPEPPAMGATEPTTLFHPSPFTMAMTPEAPPPAEPRSNGASPSVFTPVAPGGDLAGATMANPFMAAPAVTASSPFSVALPTAPPPLEPSPASPAGNPAPPAGFAGSAIPLGSLFGQSPKPPEPAGLPSPFGQAPSFGAPPENAAGSPPPAFASPFGANPFACATPGSPAELPGASPFQSAPFTPAPQKLPDLPAPASPPFAVAPETLPPPSDPMKGLFGSAPPPASVPTGPSQSVFGGRFELPPELQALVNAAPPPYSAPAEPTPPPVAPPPVTSFFPAPPTSSPAAAPASAPVPFLDQPAESPPASPFGGPTAAAAADNPFARIQALAKGLGQPATASPMPSATPNSPLPVEGFGKSVPPSVSEAAPGLPKPFAFDAPQAPADTPTASAPAPESKTGNVSGNFSMSLSAALKNCAPHDLGTVPENIPAWVKFTVPMDRIQSQLAGSRVKLSLDEILAGIDPEIRRMFAAARAGLVVELDTNAVFHALSESSATTFAPAPPLAMEKLEPIPAPAAKPQAATAMPEPFAPAPEVSWKNDLPPAAPPASTGANPFWGDTPDMGLPTSSFMLAEPEPVAKQVSPFPSFHAEPEPAKALAPAAFTPPAPVAKPSPAVIPANPLTGAPEAHASPPMSPVKVTIPRNTGSIAKDPNANSTRRLLLTILLGSGDAEDVNTFVHLTRQLPGVAAAVALQHGNSLASEGDGSTGADRFLREAAANAQLLPSLAALTGIEDSDTLHVQSGHGEATFCLHDDVVLAVLHNPEKREATLREKITLLGRELAAIVRERGV